MTNNRIKKNKRKKVFVTCVIFILKYNLNPKKLLSKLYSPERCVLSFLQHRSERSLSIPNTLYNILRERINIIRLTQFDNCKRKIQNSLV